MMVTTIEKALERADPADAGTFQANLASYKDTLTKLDAVSRSRRFAASNIRHVASHGSGVVDSSCIAW